MMQAFLSKSARAHSNFLAMCTNTYYFSTIAVRFVNLVHNI